MVHEIKSAELYGLIPIEVLKCNCTQFQLISILQVYSDRKITWQRKPTRKQLWQYKITMMKDMSRMQIGDEVAEANATASQPEKLP